MWIMKLSEHTSSRSLCLCSFLAFLLNCLWFILFEEGAEATFGCLLQFHVICDGLPSPCHVFSLIFSLPISLLGLICFIAILIWKRRNCIKGTMESTSLIYESDKFLKCFSSRQNLHTKIHIH